MYRGTRQLGWPYDIPGLERDGHHYVIVADSMKFLGMYAGLKNKGWTRFDKFVNENGMVVRHNIQPNQAARRTHLSLSYFVVLLLSGGHLQDKEDAILNYNDDIDEYKLKLYTLREFVRERCMASLINEPIAAVINDVDERAKKARISTGSMIRRVQHDNNQPMPQTLMQVGNRISQRISEQRKKIKEIAATIHGGDKSDLLEALAWDISRPSKNDEWDGTLSAEDLINVLKKGKSSRHATESLFDEIVRERLQLYHVDEHDLLFLEDTANVVETFRWLRKRIPRILASEKKVYALKKKYKAEFEKILMPTSLPGGLYVDPFALHEALMHVYHYVDGEEWWRLYGDARIMGRRQTTVLGITNVNNEQGLKGKGFHSPYDFWRIAIFYFGDERANLEANLKKGGRRYLNDWVISMQDQGHKVFVSSDAKFQDALLGGKIGPLTDDGFNIYMETKKEDNKLFDEVTGLRSKIRKPIHRDHIERLIDLPVENFGICIDHGITRIVEHQLRLVIQEIHSTTSLVPGNTGVALRRVRLQHLVNNIKARGVHRNKDGGFHITFENDQLKQISLNKPSAQLIVYPATSDFFSYDTVPFPDIFDNVLPDTPHARQLPDDLRRILNWASPTISVKQLQQQIFFHLAHMYKILRNEPMTLLPGRVNGSTSADDYSWGHLADTINKYTEHADKFHRLMLFKYGNVLTGYEMKFIDVVPQLLERYPFHSVMRLSTEQGERTHYMDMCRFYQHSTRGGGSTKQDPISKLFEWQWRMVHHRIRECPVEVRNRFEQFIATKMRPPVEELDNDGDARLVHENTIPKALEGRSIVIVGRLYKQHESIKDLIRENGGSVWWRGLPKDNIPLPQFLVITTQAECDKDPPKVVTVLAECFRRGVEILSDALLRSLENGTFTSLENYKLDLNSLKNAPYTTIQSVAPDNSINNYNSKGPSAYCMLKRKERQDRQPLQLICQNAQTKRKHRKSNQVKRKRLSGHNLFTRSSMAQIMHDQPELHCPALRKGINLCDS
ncbi:uncharacterized protein LOC117099831 [Anneissia japonica]|uniref:uncharacterized protein LOC117099831 n=1 Tax=Anneissia japonica TaxID=1529436 RepID=UPI00142576AD|nr:uncharacterized protein LOC117099831 [Anneissia japonica]